MYSLVYVGLPDFLSVDQGSAYTSSELKASIEAEGINVIEATVETLGKIGIVDRYRSPLRAVYTKLRAVLDRSTLHLEFLKMAGFFVNSTTGPEALCHILLLYGALPQPAIASPCLTHLKRARIMESAMQESGREQSKTRFSFGLKQNHGPRGPENTNDLHHLPTGSKMSIYLPTSGKLEVPHTFPSCYNETVVLQTRRGRAIFRSTCVRPCVRPTHADNLKPNNLNQASHTMPCYQTDKNISACTGTTTCGGGMC